MKTKSELPFGKIIFQHQSWVPHHIDGDNRNNNPSNLVLVPQEVYMTVKYNDTGVTHKFEIMKKNKYLLLRDIVPDKRGRMEFRKEFILRALRLHQERRDKIQRAKIKRDQKLERDRILERFDRRGHNILRTLQIQTVPIAKQLTLDL